MKIKVSCQEKPRVEKELEVHSLTFNFLTNDFEMLAGGYLIAPNQPYRPIRLHGQWDTLFITFDKAETSAAFCDWLKTANVQSEHSFTQMMD